MDLKNLLYEKKGNVAVITFNRPDKLNALSSELLRELIGLFHEMETDDEVRCVIITGNGRAFSAGGDISEEKKKDTLQGYDFVELFTRMGEAIERFKAPVIAALNGYCLGGGLEVAMCCDIRVAADNARLGSPELGLGLLPGAGGTTRLPRIIGMSRARLWIYTCEKYSAEQCYDLGVVDRIFPADTLMDEAMALAEKIAGQAPLAVKYAKILTYDGLQTDLQRAIRMEGAMAAHLFSTADKNEACSAFLEKREHKPFVGR